MAKGTAAVTPRARESAGRGRRSWRRSREGRRPAPSTIVGSGCARSCPRADCRTSACAPAGSGLGPRSRGPPRRRSRRSSASARGANDPAGRRSVRGGRQRATAELRGAGRRGPGGGGSGRRLLCRREGLRPLRLLQRHSDRGLARARQQTGGVVGGVRVRQRPVCARESGRDPRGGGLPAAARRRRERGEGGVTGRGVEEARRGPPGRGLAGSASPLGERLPPPPLLPALLLGREASLLLAVSPKASSPRRRRLCSRLGATPRSPRGSSRARSRWGWWRGRPEAPGPRPRPRPRHHHHRLATAGEGGGAPQGDDAKGRPRRAGRAGGGWG